MHELISSLPDTSAPSPNSPERKRYEHRGYRFSDTPFVQSIDFLTSFSGISNTAFAHLLHLDPSTVSAARTGHSLLGEMDTRTLAAVLQLPKTDKVKLLQERESAIKETHADKAGIGAHDMFSITIEPLQTLLAERKLSLARFAREIGIQHKEAWTLMIKDPRATLPVLRRIETTYGISILSLLDPDDPRIRLLQPDADEVSLFDSPLHRRAVEGAFPTNTVKQHLILRAATKRDLTVQDTFLLSQAVAQMSRNLHARSLFLDEEWKNAQIVRVTQRYSRKKIS